MYDLLSLQRMDCCIIQSHHVVKLHTAFSASRKTSLHLRQRCACGGHVAARSTTRLRRSNCHTMFTQDCYIVSRVVRFGGRRRMVRQCVFAKLRGGEEDRIIVAPPWYMHNQSGSTMPNQSVSLRGLIWTALSIFGRLHNGDTIPVNYYPAGFVIPGICRNSVVYLTGGYNSDHA